METAPSIDTINVIPDGYATTILNSKGKTIQTLVGKEANRQYATLDTIPKHLQNAFVAIEDERFWVHDGIDLQGIFRATFSGLSNGGEFHQGASTLTQQLLKNQVFNGGEETTFAQKLERKVQEQYLAIQLENRLTKEQILEYYLNTINLGQNTLGVQAAAKRYFDKDVSELTISESAVLAGITQNPAGYNPITHPKRNAKKRTTILSYMKDQGYITSDEYDKAMKDKVYARIKAVNKETTATQTTTSYFTDALIDQVISDMKNELGYTETSGLQRSLPRRTHNLYHAGCFDPESLRQCDQQSFVLSGRIHVSAQLPAYRNRCRRGCPQLQCRNDEKLVCQEEKEKNPSLLYG